jgi:hypothetical protein
MTEGVLGGWHSYTLLVGGLAPASPTGTLALCYYPSSMLPASSDTVTINGFTGTFNVIDLTECEQSSDKDIKYKGGIQSVDKSFSSSPILVPIPEVFNTGYDIGFIESSVITIAGVWFDGLNGRDALMEDIRTTKKAIDERYRADPLILLLSDRAYFVMVTGYSSNVVGGMGNIISFRLGLSICQGMGHYGT